MEKPIIDEELVELVEKIAQRGHRVWVKSQGIHLKEWKDVGKSTKEFHRQQARDLLLTASFLWYEGE